MSSTESLTGREGQIAQESFSSPASIETVQAFIGIPEDVTGLFILDIGGGASPATHDLNRRGARAYAVDYRYANMKDLKRSVDRYLTRPAFYEKEPSHDDVIRELGLSEHTLRKEVPPGADPRIWSMAVDLTKHRVSGESGKQQLAALAKQKEKASQLYVKHQRKARDEFFSGLDQGDDYYIPAVAGQLPFRDDTFDITFSLQTISFFLIKDRDVFLNAVQEAVRVTKLGGTVRLQPWLGTPGNPWEGEWLQTASALRDYMDDNGLQYGIKPTSPVTSPCLLIVKS